MTANTATRKIIKVPLAELKRHPRQHEVYSDLPMEEIEQLATSMKLNGLQSPIEITPDKVIICGHQRLKAAQKLAWTEIEAWVRDDLAQQGKAAVFDRLVNDNLERRQLDPLAQIRCYRALKENAKLLPNSAKSWNKRAGYLKEDLRDRLGKRFGMSGRNLDRLVKVLDAPMEVQQAVSANRLPTGDAGKVASASAEVQKKIAQEIKAGKDPKEVVKAHLPKGAKKKGDDTGALVTLLNHLRDDVPDMETRLGTMRRPKLKAHHLDILRRSAAIIQKFIAWGEEAAAQANAQGVKSAANEPVVEQAA